MSNFTSTNPTRWLAGAALLAFLTLGAAACSDDDPISSRTVSSDTSAVESDPVEVEDTQPSEDADTDTGTEIDPGGEAQATGPQAGTQSGGQAGGSQSGGGQPSGGSAGGGTQTAAPVITQFEHPETIDCHNGDFQMFTMRWSTTGADSVTISIDGPGIYDSYGPSGEASLPFSCDTPHTFLLTAHGPGGTTSKEVTLHGRNVQGSPADPEDIMDDY